jgi:aspartate/methionine/tyrosine aminotransferase
VNPKFTPACHSEAAFESVIEQHLLDDGYYSQVQSNFDSVCAIFPDIVCNVGIAQAAATVALRTPEIDIAAAVAEWQKRRDIILQGLERFSIVKLQDGWSMLLDVSEFGITGAEASQRLLEQGKIAVTPMTGWGSQRRDNFVRFVFFNEPVHRLLGLRNRIGAALK